MDLFHLWSNKKLSYRRETCNFCCVQMTSSNLAVCFLPSLFRITDFQQASPPVSSTRTAAAVAGSDPRFRPSTGTADPGGSPATTDGYQLRYKSALTCLSALIVNADYLLAVSQSHLLDYVYSGAPSRA